MEANYRWDIRQLKNLRNIKSDSGRVIGHLEQNPVKRIELDVLQMNLNNYVCKL